MKTCTKGKDESSAFCTVLTQSAGPVVFGHQLGVESEDGDWIRQSPNVVPGCAAVVSC